MTQSPLYAPHPRRRPRRQTSQRFAWIVSSLALTALAIVPRELLPQFSLSAQQQSTQSWGVNRTDVSQTCQAVLNKDQRLSREQLTQFLSVAQESSQAAIHETIAPPYCTLSRSNQSKQREAYPLAFDPDTWFVINYDQGIYKSYDFVFKE